MQAEHAEKARAEEKLAGSASRAEAQTFLEGLASRNQIFNTKEAFAMLSRELSDMMRDTVRSLGCLSSHIRIPSGVPVYSMTCEGATGRLLIWTSRCAIKSALAAEPPLDCGRRWE